MIEAQCDDDVIESANNALEDSEEFEYFYDWLIQQTEEVVTANKRLPARFYRYARFQSKGTQILQ